MENRHIQVRQWIATLLIISVITPIIPLPMAYAQEVEAEESKTPAAVETESVEEEEASGAEESNTGESSDEEDASGEEGTDQSETEKTDVDEEVPASKSAASTDESDEESEGESREVIDEGEMAPVADTDARDFKVLTDATSSAEANVEEVESKPGSSSETDDEVASSSVTSTTSTPTQITLPPSSNATDAEETAVAEEESGSSTQSSQSNTETGALATVSTDGEEVSPTSSAGAAGTSTPATEILSTTTATAATSTTIEEGEDNATTSTSTPVTIESGQAVALANVINIVNTNFVNSDGVVFFSNFLETINESIDFRWLYEALAQFGCSLSLCSDSHTTVHTSDTSTIDNHLYLEAISGNNTISGADAGVINTGNAYAGLNLINVANMNFIDSNYLLVTMNAFSDVNGDLVFPNAETFLSSLAGSPSSVSMDTSNVADVHNDVTVDANSGDNTLETSQGGSITTGTSGATTNVFNQINSTFLGGQNITILFRIHGDWVGEVFGAPPDLLWQEGADGSVFVFDSDTNTGTGGSGGASTVVTQNSATINNNVHVVALTGENKITGTETGVISAGNAYAGANIVNLANGTVVGRNWILAIVNIFGDFKGNIAFGRPDLWVGEMIDAPAKVRDGSELTYKFSVINNGDSVASNVVLTDEFDNRYLKIIDSSIPYTLTDSGELEFNLGTLASGKAAEITYTAQVVGVGNKSRDITNVVSVRSKETDDNLNDNTDTATIRTTQIRSGGGATIVGKRKSENTTIEGDASITEIAADARALQIARTPATSNVTSLSPVSTQSILLTNNGGAIIPSVEYTDVLRDPQGNIISQQSWDLGNVLPGEQIELGYIITFESGAESGNYVFSSIVKSNAYEQVYANGTVAFSAEESVPYLSSDTGPMEVASLALGQVLSALSAVQDAHHETKTFGDFELWISEGEFFLPVLTAHSMSTVTEQHNNKFGNFTLWLQQLVSQITQFIAKVAPATKT